MSNTTELNIVYIGTPPFPNGPAITKRRRFMVDYMNDNNISCHVLITGKTTFSGNNAQYGTYGKCDYYNICGNNIFKYNKVGKQYLQKWFNKNKVNVLIFPTSMSYMDYFLYRYAKKLGYRIVFDIVETTFWKHEHMGFKKKMQYRINNFLSEKAYKYAAAFVISERLSKEINEICPSMPVCILPNSTPIKVRSGRKNFNNPIKILYAGTYASKEGVTYLLDGITKVIEHGYNCKLLLLGKAPENLRKKYQNDEFVDFKGFVSDEELYKMQMESDILAMVRTNSIFSNYGFPFKLSEYLATGNVVLSTNVSDVEKYIKDKQDAYLIEPESSEAIYKAVTHIINNPSQACQIAESGLKVAYDKFSIQNVGKIFETFLKGL